MAPQSFRNRRILETLDASSENFRTFLLVEIKVSNSIGKSSLLYRCHDASALPTYLENKRRGVRVPRLPFLQQTLSCFTEHQITSIQGW